MKSSVVIRVGIFDQIVSGGGVRLFTTKLLEEFSRQSGGRWHFHLMWPHFDSSNNFLPRPRLPHTSFERIASGGALTREDRIALGLHEIVERVNKNKMLRGRALEKVRQRVAKFRAKEQEHFRQGTGAGLRWLDERSGDFDLIFIPYPYQTLPNEGAWQPQKPVVITLHDLAHEFTDAWGEATMPLRREMREWTRLANLVVFSSDYVKREAEKIYELDAERTRRIYLSPPDEPRSRVSPQAMRRRYGLPENYIFTIGWAAKHKRVETIIEGFALFRKRTQRDVALVIAGPRTETLLSENLHGLKVGEDVFALGYVRDEEIGALYENAALVVTASISEAGLNSMIFDAMTKRRAIVCSNIPQFTERLGTDDALAVMFDSHSPESLCNALEKHFANPQEAESRILKAKTFVAARTLADVGRDYLAAFESLL